MLTAHCALVRRTDGSRSPGLSVPSAIRAATSAAILRYAKGSSGDARRDSAGEGSAVIVNLCRSTIAQSVSVQVLKLRISFAVVQWNASSQELLNALHRALISIRGRPPRLRTGIAASSLGARAGAFAYRRSPSALLQSGPDEPRQPEFP